MPKHTDKPMKWTEAHEFALKLVFEGRWTQEEIARKLVEAEDVERASADSKDSDTQPAAQASPAAAPEMSERVRISTRTLRRWITHPDFQKRLEALRSDLAAALRDVAYADKKQRIIGLAQMAESARREYEERPWLREVRQIGHDAESGEPLTMTNESFNRDAHAAFRASLADIAAELGERKNVTELSGKDGKPIEISDARQRLAARLAALAQRRRTSGSAVQPE